MTKAERFLNESEETASALLTLMSIAKIAAKSVGAGKIDQAEAEEAVRYYIDRKELDWNSGYYPALDKFKFFFKNMGG